VTKKHADGKTRCSWCGDEPSYVAYHDNEWGVPEWDDRALFEKLLLDGFQAGLSWFIILRKRDNFRRAFDGFSPELMARYDDAKLASLMADSGIVRNKAKINAAVGNARAWLEIQEHENGFSDYLWSFVGGAPIVNRWRNTDSVPAETAESKAMSKDLKRRGFKFCGPTICYAFMQAVGMVNDHAVDCYRHTELDRP
jgi:DNA-3-methyladenine glycosylase I